MDIHGTDVIFATDMGLDETKLAVSKYLKDRFPAGVFEEIDDEYENGLLFYMDGDAKKSWDDLGWNPSNDDRMWHFIFHPPEVTVVVGDEPSDETNEAMVDIQEIIAC